MRDANGPAVRVQGEQLDEVIELRKKLINDTYKQRIKYLDRLSRIIDHVKKKKDANKCLRQIDAFLTEMETVRLFTKRMH